jgi:isoaspartyl peptidase/L-asparaginase-like protein (Ntn-hydrolase superfamily)
MSVPTIVVHGGAGDPVDGVIADEAPYHAALEEALRAGAAVLAAGADALGAAQAAVARLEDAPVFNAGRGSVLTSAGTVEMDAAIADGRTRNAGAVAVVTTVRHPIALARAVMDSTPHLMFAGAGAERLADELGLERVDQSWLITDRERARHEGGTVGAVVLDAHGGLAAATSTGGLRGQPPGRVGDTPVIGAGTWADETVAVSATGDGEGMIRRAAAHEISALVRHTGLDVTSACERVLGDVRELGGTGGLIAVDAAGGFATPFTTAVMHRGWLIGGGEPQTAVR